MPNLFRTLTVALLTGWVLPFAAAAQPSDFETLRIAEGVYQFRFRIHYSFFVVTPAGVVAFDPISTEAAAHYAREIQRVAPGRPLAAIVYTHDHWDHATGANVLRGAFDRWVPIIAHENTYGPIAESERAGLIGPDLTFRDRMTLGFGGRPIELHYLGKNHGDSMLVAYVPDVKVINAVDLVSKDAVGFRDIDSYIFPDYFDSLQRLQGFDYDAVVFGHYWPAGCRDCTKDVVPATPGDRGTIARQIRYYDDLRRAVTDAIERRLTEDEAAAQVRLPAYEAWGGYHVWIEGNVRAIHRWLSASAPR